MKLMEDFKSMLISTIKSMMDQVNILKPLTSHNYSPKSQYPTTVVPSNSRAPPLDGGPSTQIIGVWTLKHEISSLKFSELPIKT